MKNRVFLGLSLCSLIGAFVLNGCKATATDPVYVALAEIRFANYHQVEPLQFYMYPDNAIHSDSLAADQTPTPTTYGIITPYITNISTNRTAGRLYHLIAVNAVSKAIVQHENVTLKPGDRYTWIVAGNSGTFDTTLINDNLTGPEDTSLSYFRFINVTPGGDPESLLIGDPLNGFQIATGVTYLQMTKYVGVHSAPDTSVTFYVVDQANGTVLGRLAGVALDKGGYHTVTWGGSVRRIVDPNGNTSLNDTTRIRIWNDDPTQGVDLTYSVPTTFRFNLINALLPPISPNANFIDYSQSGGLALVINNNTAYDYNHLMPFSFAPSAVANSTDPSVWDQVPTAIPYNPGVDKIYIKMVQPLASAPSPADPILFRFYAGLTGPQGGQFKSDQLYTIVVWDTVRTSDPKKQSNATTGYDSNYAATVPVSDVPVAGSAKILIGYMLAAPVKPLSSISNNGAKFFVNGNQLTKIKNVKQYDTTTVTAGTVNFEAQVGSPNIDTDVKFSFTAESGGIYEAFFVGQRGRPNDAAKYGPRWIVVRVNPIRN